MFVHSLFDMVFIDVNFVYQHSHREGYIVLERVLGVYLIHSESIITSERVDRNILW